jgi:hypothetical protein
MSDSKAKGKSKASDKAENSSEKSYVKWKVSNCGGISCHGEELCFVVVKEGDKSECKCVNRPDFDCTLYYKLGTSAYKHKPYLKSSDTTWIKWGGLACDEFPDQFSGLNSETLKKQFRFALEYTKKALNLTPETAGVETHPNITPFFKLFRKIYEEQEREQLTGQLGGMLTAAKQDSMLTFEANILSPVTTTRSISGILSASLSSKRSTSTPVSQQRDTSPNSENEIDSKADPTEEDDSSNIFDALECSDKLLSAEDSAAATKVALSKATNSELKAKLDKGIDEVLV